MCQITYHLIDIIRKIFTFSSLLLEKYSTLGKFYVKYDLDFDLGYMSFIFKLLDNIIYLLNVSDNLLLNRYNRKKH